MRFIHTSDWHIGNYFCNFSKVENEELGKGRLKTIESIFQYANKYKIRLMLVSGDQFDSDNIGEAQVLELFNIIKKHSQIKVIMIAGNHDPFTTNSIYNKILQEYFPDNLIFVKDKETIFLEEYNCKIYASSLKEKNSKDNPIEWLDDVAENESFKIAICHGSIMIEGKYSENDFPIPLDIAKTKKLDYVAAGHFHSYLEIDKRLYYPGTPEQLQFKDKGYALDVSLEKNKTPNVEKIENLCYYNWIEVNHDINDQNYKNIIQDIEKKFNQKNIIELNITGYLSPDNFKNFNVFLDSISNSFFKIFIDNKVKIKPEIDIIESVLDESYIKDVMNKLFRIKESNKTPANINISDEIIGDVVDVALINIYNFYKEN